MENDGGGGGGGWFSDVFLLRNNSWINHAQEENGGTLDFLGQFLANYGEQLKTDTGRDNSNIFIFS